MLDVIGDLYERDARRGVACLPLRERGGRLTGLTDVAASIGRGAQPRLFDGEIGGPAGFEGGDRRAHRASRCARR